MGGLTDAAAVDLWDTEARTFDDGPDHGLHDPSCRNAWAELLLAVMPAAPARVADLGCGTGTLSVLLAEEGYVVDGVDFSPEMLRRGIAKAGGRVRFTIGDAADPPLADACYDVVLCRHVLWALPDPAAALARWTRLLAPGGRLLLVEGDWGTGAGLTSATVVSLLSQVGRSGAVRYLTEPVFWGRTVEDERFLVVSRT
ncbi:class I SAM-dependent methyltransferase [Nocardioides sp. 616]|uniref:class I SAM-dependent methyltransferase n=1 Tax=Nocardioides sp. 616 TaxID=2268090 RepID=UPI0019643C18|nr:class I SAM-dependent methyltransferase [Nocardioides sp. 616]